MILTLDILRAYGACEDGIEWYKQNPFSTVEDTIRELGDQCWWINVAREKCDLLDWSVWLLTRVLSLQDRIRSSIFSAREVLPLFEREFPADQRPRKAIEAAEKFLAEPIAASAASYVAVRSAAAAAAADADAASYAAVRSAAAAYAAASASYAAVASASVAADYASYAVASSSASAVRSAAAAYAAYAASYVAVRSAAADADAAYAREKMQKKIIAYGMKLIQQEKK